MNLRSLCLTSAGAMTMFWSVACGSVSPSTTDASTSASTDGGALPDAGCPVSAPTSGALCAAANQVCSGPVACVVCGPGLWDKESVWDCFCSSGKWSCGIRGACIPGPATFHDSACTVPSLLDAGAADAPSDG